MNFEKNEKYRMKEQLYWSEYGEMWIKRETN